MAGLYDRIVPTAGDNRIAVHRLYASLTEYLRGELTIAQIRTAFGFENPSDENDDLVAMQGQLDSAVDAAAKGEYIQAVHSVWTLVELGDYTEAKARSSLKI
jgi:hypothetical protein